MRYDDDSAMDFHERSAAPRDRQADGRSDLPPLPPRGRGVESRPCAQRLPTAGPRNADAFDQL